LQPVGFADRYKGLQEGRLGIFDQPVNFEFFIILLKKD